MKKLRHCTSTSLWLDCYKLNAIKSIDIYPKPKQIVNSFRLIKTLTSCYQCISQDWSAWVCKN